MAETFRSLLAIADGGPRDANGLPEPARTTTTGWSPPAHEVAERLRDLQIDARAGGVVVLTPAIDRARRVDSYRAIAEAWPRQ